MANSFSPFAGLSSKKSRRNTLAQQCSATFKLFFGRIGKTTDSDFDYLSPGLFDWLLLPLGLIHQVLFGLGINANKGEPGKVAARNTLVGISFIFAIPKLIIASVLTFAFLPLIAIAHGFAQIKGSKYKNKIKNIEFSYRADPANKPDEKTTLKIGTVLKQHKAHLSSKTATSTLEKTTDQTTGEEKITGVKISFPNKLIFTLHYNDKKEAKAIKYMRKLDVGNVDRLLKREEKKSKAARTGR